jgi:SAM-dependent methyltransferase
MNPTWCRESILPVKPPVEPVIASAPAQCVPVTGVIERFDSFWEGPADVAKGYRRFGTFYRANYLHHLPSQRGVRMLVISCGPGYFVNLLAEEGYTNVTGIDSDPSRVAWAKQRGLNCQHATAFEFLQGDPAPYDVIICEQELNHLTKAEMIAFLRLVASRLKRGGTLLCHGLNGANPIVGAETLAQNFDHYNTFTAYSLQQVLEYTGFRHVRVFGLNLYVFYANPFNYVAWAASALLSLGFRVLFILYGKHNRIFTKKIGAVATKPD